MVIHPFSEQVGTKKYHESTKDLKHEKSRNKKVLCFSNFVFSWLTSAVFIQFGSIAFGIAAAVFIT